MQQLSYEEFLKIQIYGEDNCKARAIGNYIEAIVQLVMRCEDTVSIEDIMPRLLGSKNYH